VTTALRGHSDAYRRLRTAPIAIILLQQIYKQRSATVCNMVHGIFLTRPDHPWGSGSLLYKLYRVSLPGVKRPGRGVDHTPPSRVEDKERVELYLYSNSGHSCPVIGWTLHFTFHLQRTQIKKFFFMRFSPKFYYLFHAVIVLMSNILLSTVPVISSCFRQVNRQVSFQNCACT